jgi:hypothetical protein
MHRHINNPIRCRYTSRCSSAEERLKPQPSPPSTRNGLTEGWLSAHNGEDVGSKPTTGIIQFTSFTEAGRHSSSDAKHEQTLHRHGAGAARGAHNSEVTGSKPVAGIYLHIAMVHQGTGANPNTAVAQGQRAGLITPRSLDRNGSAVLSNSSALEKQSVIAQATFIKT